MFAYCLNNPINYVDSTGALTSLPDGPQQFGQSIGEFIGEWIKATVDTSTKEDLSAIESGQVTYSSNGAGKGARIQNSHQIKTPWVMYDYVAENRGNEIEGTTTGVVAEWVVHNVAYESGKILGIESISIPAANLDVGKTIFSDRREGLNFKSLMSLGMKIGYTIISPITALYDLSIETGRWDWLYANG